MLSRQVFFLILMLLVLLNRFFVLQHIEQDNGQTSTNMSLDADPGFFIGSTKKIIIFPAVLNLNPAGNVNMM
ncbi:hypothetical protein LCM00_04905 [Bacillus infantis]|uniref:hypothetical protein n=1 Tax=Bacillus infantis TaxID=324767 RepID=UPI001CD2BEA9|nr:hypothetical protein [Bacillus infantis]MCA1038841.1 hypothetical protein [Bacillus infantis]